MKLQNLFEQEEKTLASISWISKILDKNGNMPETIDDLTGLSGWGLTTLVGCSKRVTTSLDCTHNKLTSLDGFPLFIGEYLNFSNNQITSLKDIGTLIKSVQHLQCDDNPITSNVLGLLKIRNLQSVKMYNDGKSAFKPLVKEINEKLKIVEAIINKYLPEGDIMDCQNELIDAGLSEYAKL